MELISEPQVADVFKGYAPDIRQKIQHLRQVIIDTASETEGLKKLTETLKWGEPSYVTKRGSPIRIDWKRSNPQYYAMYFICTTTLVETFRMVYGDLFQYQGNRAILFHLDDKIPVTELKHCISLALTYRQIKHLPMLGV
ncbi:DUF1801 domain-containing protein [Fulvivirga sp. M361]|uniref:DUF1801 domain-containing protein n=1 Tax=Fulvivirga sp. M361 TaxID=2594266 RepID=UPI00117B41AF|nr:DUF1801 domain-containing protein [Fulvivirga sp. M361]TRX60474.1 DUF1801 domain-containing protein [Fulvivirga sp. M361]